MKHLIATIVDSQTYALAAVERLGDQPKQYVFRGPEIRRLTAEQFADAVASITGDWHVAPRSADTPAPKSSDLNEYAAGDYSREWRIAATSLTRTLGRPIRDQVFSTRDNSATTIQAIELMNGETLTHWLNRGAARMLGDLPPEPRSLYATQLNASRDTTAPSAPFDIDVSHSSKLFFIVQDALSTAPDKALPRWLNLELEGPAGSVPLASLTPLDRSALREGDSSTLKVKLSSVLVYDLSDAHFTRLHGAPGFEPMQLAQGESVHARFFIFDHQPDMDRLVPPRPETPLPEGPVLKSTRDIENRVFEYALGRNPSPAERRIADSALQNSTHPGAPSPDALADLLWAVLMKPEFQLIY
jgi:hypothetical protein